MSPTGEPEEHERLADDLSHEADRMSERSDEVQDDISHARDEWAAKRRDRDVPGAPPPESSGSASDEDAPGGE